MNAKEDTIEYLNELKSSFEDMLNVYKGHWKSEELKREIDKLNSLIESVKNAIFDVPSEDEIIQAAQDFSDKDFLPTAHYKGFIAGCNFILNYKKPKSDGK